MARRVATLMLLAASVQAWGQPVTGSADVSWHEGAVKCDAASWEPLQVHAYEPMTYILRQNPCAHFEANVIYLLVGGSRALLIDTGPAKKGSSGKGVRYIFPAPMLACRAAGPPRCDR